MTLLTKKKKFKLKMAVINATVISALSTTATKVTQILVTHYIEKTESPTSANLRHAFTEVVDFLFKPFAALIAAY